MKRIDGTVAGYYAVKHDLPPLPERPNPSTVAAFDRWILHLPGQAACWSDYAMLGCSLADFPGVRPAIKHFPEATHELTVHAVDPAFPREALAAGGVALLEPVNYVAQVVTTDDRFRLLLEELAVRFVNGELAAEPDGVYYTECRGGRMVDMTAREWFVDLCREMVRS